MLYIIIMSAIYEYIWIGGNNELRSKTRILSKQYANILQIPLWNYDGSSTGQGTTEESEITLRPVKIYDSPCKYSNYASYIVLCATYIGNTVALHNNYRDEAEAIFSKYEEKEAWYGLEQEYFMYDVKTQQPLGYENATKQGQYYCAVGANNTFGRTLAEEHMIACLDAGIQISGINQEVAPGQWEFQIGPVVGLDACDDLWTARYILEKLAEKYGIYIVYHPKPLLGDWNGSGLHTNFSTKEMRENGGLDVIKACMEKLEKRHAEHISVYGENNDLRLTGHHETSSMSRFSWSVGGRQGSVRIGNDTEREGKGYFEDRRPAANMNPYLVCPIILETCYSYVS